SAYSFVDSIGVNVHFPSSAIYYNGSNITSLWIPVIESLGIMHARDTGAIKDTQSGYDSWAFGNYSKIASTIQSATGHHFGFDLIMSPRDGGSSTPGACNLLTDAGITYLTPYLSAQYIDTFEGLNEYNIEVPYTTPGCVGTANWTSEDASFQQAL